MIVSLRGKLIEAGVLRVVIESSGVGYEVNVPVTTAERLPKLGAEVFLLIHHVFREDGQALYGFAVAEEREFKAPDADKGVRAALAKLGAGATADQLVKAALGR
jgi:Holliday junction resolvasome RuvABC DNA-binding subunit